ncbi:isoprenyl transferase [Desulfobacterales bacterium HSG16]|nr:isoprenyl transferase [Desulfobacterales bacterium HSG16]
MSSEKTSYSLDLDEAKIPSHVAIIMDGNGRWAKKRILNRVKGHERGMEVVRTIVRTSRNIGVSYLTLFAFSTENWQRPRLEVSALMSLLKKFLVSERDELHDNNVRLNMVGQKERLPGDVKKLLDETMSMTGKNTGMVLNLAISYGSRDEILQMVRHISKRVNDGDIKLDEINHKLISNHLYTAGMPDPDILIRTSGEMRISNFLLWQIAYSELFITRTLWPDFTEQEYIEIIKDFQQRDRRFGKV